MGNMYSKNSKKQTCNTLEQLAHNLAYNFQKHSIVRRTSIKNDLIKMKYTLTAILYTIG